MIDIYTDGSMQDHGGVDCAGWGFCYLPKGEKKKWVKFWGGVDGGTNNRGEMMGCIRAVQHAANVELGDITLCTDSNYTLLGYTERLQKWMKNKWKTSTGDPVKNVDLWKLLLKEIVSYENKVGGKVRWKKVVAHTGIDGNEVADGLAKRGTISQHTGAKDGWVDESDKEAAKAKAIKVHPLLAGRKMLVETNKATGGIYPVETPNENEAGIKGRGTGVPSGTAMQGLVILNEPDEFAETIRLRVDQEFNKLRRPGEPRDLQRPVEIYWQSITGAKMLKQWGQVGMDCIYMDGDTMMAWNDNGKCEVATVLRAPRHFYTCLDEMSVKGRRLDAVLQMLTEDKSATLTQSIREGSYSRAEPTSLGERLGFRGGSHMTIQRGFDGPVHHSMPQFDGKGNVAERSFTVVNSSIAEDTANGGYSWSVDIDIHAESDVREHITNAIGSMADELLEESRYNEALEAHKPNVTFEMKDHSSLTRDFFNSWSELLHKGEASHSSNDGGARLEVFSLNDCLFELNAKKKRMMRKDLSGSHTFTKGIRLDKHDSSVKLTMGRDLPTRNQIGAMLKHDKDMNAWLVVHDFEPGGARYSVVIVMEDGRAIFNSPNGNFVML